MLYNNEDGSWSFRTEGCGCCSEYYKFYENSDSENEWEEDSISNTLIIEYIKELEEQIKRANELLKLMEVKAKKQIKEE
jgi:hypothetical protein